MRIFLLALCACLHVIGWGQTSDIGGIVNTYHKVTTTYTDKFSVTVNDATGLKLRDLVMVIQMKGATVSTNNNSNFGDVSNLGNAGNYEINQICKIDGNRVYFVYKLKKDYSVADKVQLVRIPSYSSARVSSKLEAASWDNTTGTGGILAINVGGTLTLDAPVSADGKGFKGGVFTKSGNYCTDNVYRDYFYDPSLVTVVVDYIFWKETNYDVQKGAPKGESVYDFALAMSGGRGKVANGGGGGNNHNTAGGGGSNLGLGGDGGKNTTSDGCKSDYNGLGGAILDTTGKRLFLGGGGGSGHGNNTPQAGGGNGGGIIFIMAETLIDNGQSISANGQDGSGTTGDGASGGGGGGSIILSVNSYDGVINVTAKGGNGGSINNEDYSTRCFGEGGGGGGGAIYFKKTIPTGAQVQGGIKGERINSKGCTTASIASNGGNGGVTANYGYEKPTVLANGCPETSPLPVTLLSFKVTHIGAKASITWSVSHAEDAAQYILQRRRENDNWKDVQVIQAEDRTTTYQKADGPLATGIYLYRLKIVEKDRSVSYSPIQQITIKAEDINRLLIHPNPATSEITIVAPAGGEEWLNIYDMKSRLVYRKKVTPNDSVIKQDVSFLSEGVYMIQVGKLTARFVVFK